MCASSLPSCHGVRLLVSLFRSQFLLFPWTVVFKSLLQSVLILSLLWEVSLCYVDVANLFISVSETYLFFIETVTTGSYSRGLGFKSRPWDHLYSLMVLFYSFIFCDFAQFVHENACFTLNYVTVVSFHINWKSLFILSLDAI